MKTIQGVNAQSPAHDEVVIGLGMHTAHALLSCSTRHAQKIIEGPRPPPPMHLHMRIHPMIRPAARRKMLNAIRPATTVEWACQMLLKPLLCTPAIADCAEICSLYPRSGPGSKDSHNQQHLAHSVPRECQRMPTVQPAAQVDCRGTSRDAAEQRSCTALPTQPGVLTRCRLNPKPTLASIIETGLGQPTQETSRRPRETHIE